MVTQTPVAFVLVKFQGSSDEPMSMAQATQMFTAAGRGTMNVVDWFDDNTHGSVDMTGNAVFGWLQLTDTVDKYRSLRTTGEYGRSKICDLGRAAAADAGINLSRFTAVVVVTNVEVDMFGSAGNVCCTAATAGKQFWEMQAAPAVLCQEIIHGLGVNEHARQDGSDTDYTDPFDVMSMFTNSDHCGHSPANPSSPVGPGLNAAFMKRCGWLDATRAAPAGQVVALRPLHRRDLSGSLYSMLGQYYVEYRRSERWDTGFPSVVLVHHIANQTSYLAANLVAGAEFSGTDELSPFGSVKVETIDDAASTATIRLRQWNWLNMGKPAGPNIRARLGAVTVMDTPTSPQRPHVFVEGDDYNLWCRWSDGATWSWLNMGKPAGANIIGFAGAVTVMDTPTSPQRPHLFVAGNDGKLWCRWSNGATWSWLNMGKPQSANIRGMLGAVTVMDTPTSPQRPHVFVEGDDYNLWCRWSDGATWSWLNMGKPQSANIIGFAGAVTVRDTPTSPQRPHLFVAGNDGNIWCRWSNGATWSWLNMGKPQGANIRGMLGAVTVMDTPTSPQRPHVFVEGDDYNLWCLWSDGNHWSWLNMGKPAGANIIGFAGAVTLMDTPTSPQRPHLFVEGNDGNIWCRKSNGATWIWLNMGKPQSANIAGLMGAVTVMDTPTSPQRPHVFVAGNDGNLWCDWWG